MSSAGNNSPRSPLGPRPFRFEPNDDADGDNLINPQLEEPEIVLPASEWCTCGHCQDMPTNAESVCCHNHDARYKLNDRGQVFNCISDHPGVLELMAIAPLENAWSNYLCYHNNLFPNGEPAHNSKNRLCAYRNMVYWIFPGIMRKERRPLPSCLVFYIRTYFTPTDDEEVFADYVFSGFCYGDEETRRDDM